MRIKRSFQLSPLNGTVHLYWRCHNKEFYLQPQSIKELYLNCLKDALEYKKQNENCKIHAFCAMDNHFHQSVSYTNGSMNLSNFMRYAHSLFGIRYNRSNQRSGKVAEGRPKTPLIQDITYEMRVHFYIEANPIRAKIYNLENLKKYHYSSYGFYAFGIKSKFTDLLTVPEWYTKLGATNLERQKKYRKLFKDYLDTYSDMSSLVFKRSFIGDFLWVEESLEKLKRVIEKNLNPSSLHILPNSS